MDEVQAIENAVSDPNGPSPEEKALVAKWAKALMHARKGDKKFRDRVARDRSYASGEALDNYEVSTNLVAAMIDTLIPFIYAKDPDVDVVPQDQVSAPVRPRLMPPKPPVAEIDPNTGQPMLAPDGLPISPGPEAVMQYQAELAEYQRQQEELEAEAQQDRENADYVRRLGQTLEIVISRLWKKANLKAEAKKQLRGSMTAAEGWLKVSMVGELEIDHTVQKELFTYQDQLKTIQALQKCVQEGDTTDYDAEIAKLEALIVGLEGKLENYVGRCLAIDWVDTLDMQWPLSLRTMSEYVSSPWGADATYYDLLEACAKFDLNKGQLASAARWKPPTTWEQEGWNSSDSPTDGESWTKLPDNEDGYVRCWEINCKRDNLIYTWIEGTDFWAKQPHAPRLKTTRFYPYFLLSLYEIDGQRHPQSLAWRLHKLQDEYSSARSNFKETRARSKPGILFDATQYDDVEVRKIEESENQEYVGLKPVRPGQPIGQAFTAKPYARVDPGLYDTQPIRNDMETVSGAQEALSQGVSVAKTATEAEIQQVGTTARTGYSRDATDMMYDDMALYCAELALGGIPVEQVRLWAGPHAVWPKGIETEKLEAMVHVAIRAGSTGKPNTNADRQAWSAILPQLQALMMQIGQFRGADPQEMADKLTELLRETVARTGDRLDVDRFLPMPSPQAQNDPMNQMPIAAPPGAETSPADAQPPQNPMGN